MFGDRRHFRTLLRESEEGIASNILANRLRRLVDEGLLTRDDPGAEPAGAHGAIQQRCKCTSIRHRLVDLHQRHFTVSLIRAPE